MYTIRSTALHNTLKGYFTQHLQAPYHATTLEKLAQPTAAILCLPSLCDAYCAITRNMDTSPGDLEVPSPAASLGVWQRTDVSLSPSQPPSLPIHLCDWTKPLSSVLCPLLQSGGYSPLSARHLVSQVRVASASLLRFVTGKKPTVDQLDALQTEFKEWEESITQ